MMTIHSASYVTTDFQHDLAGNYVDVETPWLVPISGFAWPRDGRVYVVFAIVFKE